MACNPPDCLPTTPAGAGLQVVNAPQRTCSGQAFCDPKLEGLPFANQIDLVGVPEGDQCLHRIGAFKGVWQHDSSKAGGADYVGPLESVQFIPAANAGTSECGQLPLLRDVIVDGKAAVEIAAQNLAERSDGEIGLINKCAGGKVRQDIMSIEAFDDDNPCELNLSILGWVNQVVIVNGVNTIVKKWKQLTRLLFPATQLTELGTPDYSAGTAWRRAAWKKVGDCWELGLPTADAATPDCSAIPSVGSTFDYLIACDGGVEKKVEPTIGMGLVGDGTNWNKQQIAPTILAARHFVGQKNAGFTTTTNITGVVHTTGATSGSQSGTFDMTTVPGYVAGRAKVAIVEGVVIVNTVSPGEALAQVKLNNEVRAEGWIDSNFGFGINNGGVDYLVALTGDTFTFELVASASNAGVQAWSKLSIRGWQ